MPIASNLLEAIVALGSTRLTRAQIKSIKINYEIGDGHSKFNWNGMNIYQKGACH